MNDRYVTYVSCLKVSRMKYARVFLLRIFHDRSYAHIHLYKLVSTRFDWTTRFRIYLHRCELKNKRVISEGTTEYLLLLTRSLPPWYEYTLSTSLRRKNKRAGKRKGVDRWKIWTEFNQFVCCPSAIEATFRKSIATCYWNDPIHPGGFFLPRAISLREGMHNGTRLRKSNIRHRAKTP